MKIEAMKIRDEFAFLIFCKISALLSINGYKVNLKQEKG